MFSLLSGLWQYLFTKPTIHILIIGLDHAGKSTILEKIKTLFGKIHGLPPEKIPPTIGMNLAKINYQGSQVVIWDLGGQIKMRSIWEKYYDEANAVIFVIDSSDTNRFIEAKLALISACENETLKSIPIVIFANKVDLQSKLTIDEIYDSFSEIRGKLDKNTIYRVSGYTGQGLEEAVKFTIEEATNRLRK
eukprot:gene17822-23433_t